MPGEPYSTILRSPWLAWPLGAAATRSRRPHRRCGKPAPGIVARPPSHLHHLVEDHLHHLVEDLALVLLRGLHIRLGVPGGDLGTRRHRQPTLHASRRSPFRGHSYVRHRGCFAGTFRESSRVLVTQTGREYPGHAQRRSSFFVLNLESVQNVSRTRRCGLFNLNGAVVI